MQISIVEGPDESDPKEQKLGKEETTTLTQSMKALLDSMSSTEIDELFKKEPPREALMKFWEGMSPEAINGLLKTPPAISSGLPPDLFIGLQKKAKDT